MPVRPPVRTTAGLFGPRAPASPRSRPQRAIRGRSSSTRGGGRGPCSLGGHPSPPSLLARGSATRPRVSRGCPPGAVGVARWPPAGPRSMSVRDLFPRLGRVLARGDVRQQCPRALRTWARTGLAKLSPTRLGNGMHPTTLRDAAETARLAALLDLAQKKKSSHPSVRAPGQKPTDRGARFARARACGDHARVGSKRYWSE